MFSRISSKHVAEKMFAIGQEFGLLKDTNVRLASLQTECVVREAIKDNLTVAGLSEDLVRLWFPFVHPPMHNGMWDSRWIDINTRASEFILKFVD